MGLQVVNLTLQGFHHPHISAPNGKRGLLVLRFPIKFWDWGSQAQVCIQCLPLNQSLWAGGSKFSRLTRSGHAHTLSTGAVSSPPAAALRLKLGECGFRRRPGVSEGKGEYMPAGKKHYPSIRQLLYALSGHIPWDSASFSLERGLSICIFRKHTKGCWFTAKIGNDWFMEFAVTSTGQKGAHFTNVIPKDFSGERHWQEFTSIVGDCSRGHHHYFVCSASFPSSHPRAINLWLPLLLSGWPCDSEEAS